MDGEFEGGRRRERGEEKVGLRPESYFSSLLQAPLKLTCVKQPFINVDSLQTGSDTFAVNLLAFLISPVERMDLSSSSSSTAIVYYLLCT